MNTVRKLLFREMAASIVLVTLAFQALFSFIDFVEELGIQSALLGPQAGGRMVARAALATLLHVPGHLYDLAPLSVLIGTIYALSRMAQASEFTVLRTGGLGPVRALGLLLVPGAAGVLVTFALGEWVAPRMDNLVRDWTRQVAGNTPLKPVGLWLKDQRGSVPGADHSTLHVGAADSQGGLAQVRIFEFDQQARLLRRMEAPTASVDDQGVWLLRDVTVVDWPGPQGGAVRHAKLDTLPWSSTLTAQVIQSAMAPVDKMATLDLWRYGRHLAEQGQSSQTQDLQFWRRVFYPLSCLVMSALALPFAYLHARSGGVSLKVFGGVLLGISFVLLNNLAGHIGLLQQATPWLASAWPSGLYMALSLGAFTWLVRFR